MKEPYQSRIVDSVLSFYLESVGAVLIKGSKWCGKMRGCEASSNGRILTIWRNFGYDFLRAV